MQIALSESQEDFVKQAVTEGRYASEKDLIDEGLRLVEARDQKLSELRAIIQESLKDPRIVSEEELDQALEDQEAQLIAMGIPE
jgi:putative addiction module CopG family antidote